MNEFAERLQQSPAIRRFVTALLDKIDRLGNVPGSFTVYSGDYPNVEEIRWFFGPGFIVINDTKLKLHLKKLLDRQPDLVSRLFQALKRPQRNLPLEKNELAAQLLTIIDSFAEPAIRVFSDYLPAERQNAAACRGELYSLAQKDGCHAVKEYLTALSHGFAFLSADSQPVRLSRFGLEVAGNTKCCRTGSFLLKSFARILYQFDQKIRTEVDLSQPINDSEKFRLVLDQTRLQVDGSASQIQVFGNLVLKKHGELFDYVKKHAGFGEPVVLAWAQLNGAEVVVVPAKVVCIENETTFFEYAANADPSLELVICTMGQANRLLVKLLTRLKESITEIYHWGDLDRSGVLILDSLRRRTGLNILPMHMDVSTFVAHQAKGRALPAEERDWILALLQKRPEIICADLLQAIVAHQLWIEQENLSCYC